MEDKELTASTGMTSLRDYLRVIFRHKAVFIILPIAVLIPVLIAQKFKTPVYEASVKMLVSGQKETEPDYYKGIIDVKGITQDHAELVKSSVVIERVVSSLKLYQIPLDYEKNFSSRLKAASIERKLKKLKLRLDKMKPEQRQNLLFKRAVAKLRGNIDVIPIKHTNLFNITVKDFSPVGAAIIANAVSRSYIIFDIEQQVAELQLKYGKDHSSVIQLKNYIEELYKTLDGKPLPAIEAIGPASVKIIEQASPGRGAVGGANQLTLVFSFFASIFFGVLLAFGFEYFDQTFKSQRDVETFLNIPFLGSIPKRKSKDKLLNSSAKPSNANYTQSYQMLSNHVYILLKDKNLISVLITDAEGSEETTVVIANLGIHLAHYAGHRVLIIDANLRAPSISKIFNISDSPGLADVLEGIIPFEDAVQDVGSNLYVLPTNKTYFNPGTIIASPMMSDVIKKAKEQYEIIFINCANLKDFADTTILSSVVDGTILVVNEGKIRRQVFKNVIAPLEQKKSNIIGVILNNRTYVIPGIIYKRV